MDRSWLRDAAHFLISNVQHYALALWGIRLQLDPERADVVKFFPSLLGDTVLEYRTYGGIILWAVFVAAVVPENLLWPLIVFWGIRAWWRSRAFRSGYHFWRQAWRESPGKCRTRIEYSDSLQLRIQELEAVRPSKGPDITATWDIEDAWKEKQAFDRWIVAALQERPCAQCALEFSGVLARAGIAPASSSPASPAGWI